jgi:hypothetical protein
VSVSGVRCAPGVGVGVSAVPGGGRARCPLWGLGAPPPPSAEWPWAAAGATLVLLAVVTVVAVARGCGCGCRRKGGGSRIASRRTTSFYTNTSRCFCEHHMWVDIDEVWRPTDLVNGYKRGPECRINYKQHLYVEQPANGPI